MHNRHNTQPKYYLDYKYKVIGNLNYKVRMMRIRLAL